MSMRSYIKPFSTLGVLHFVNCLVATRLDVEHLIVSEHVVPTFHLLKPPGEKHTSSSEIGSFSNQGKIATY